MQDGTPSGLILRPYDRMSELDNWSLRKLAKPLDATAKITSAVKDGALVFKDEVTGSTSRIALAELDEEVREKLKAGQPADPFKRLAKTNRPKITLRQAFAVSVSGLALAVAAAGTYEVSKKFEAAVEAEHHISVTMAAALENIPLTGMREPDLYDAVGNKKRDSDRLALELYYFNAADAAFLRQVEKGDTRAVAATIKAADKDMLLTTGPLAVVTATKNGDVDMLRLLLTAGANANEAYTPRDNYNGRFVPLLIAVERGMPQCVDLLLQKGANPDVREKPSTQTAFMMAAYSFYNEKTALSIMEKLRLAGANLAVEMEPGGQDALSLSLGNIAKMTYVLDHLPDAAAAVNKPYKYYSVFYGGVTTGQSLLSMAIDHSGYDIKGVPASIQLLLDRGADAAAADPEKFNAIHHAAALDQMDVIKTLMKRGTDARLSSLNGLTPLDVANNAFPHPINAQAYLKTLKGTSPKVKTLAPG